MNGNYYDGGMGFSMPSMPSWDDTKDFFGRQARRAGEAIVGKAKEKGQEFIDQQKDAFVDQAMSKARGSLPSSLVPSSPKPKASPKPKGGSKPMNSYMQSLLRSDLLNARVTPAAISAFNRRAGNTQALKRGVAFQPSVVQATQAAAAAPAQKGMNKKVVIGGALVLAAVVGAVVIARR